MPRKILRDDPWERIKDLLPSKPGDRDVQTADNRLFIEAILWLLRTGAPWRDRPPEFGRWHTAYMRFARWLTGRVWERLFAAVRQDADLDEVFIDSTAICAYLHAVGAPQKTVRNHWADLVAVGVPKSTGWLMHWTILCA